MHMELRIVMLPWLAHGHASPFLELAKRLSCRNMVVYLCSTPAVLISLKDQFDDHTSFPSIHFVELHLPSLSLLPTHLHTTKHLPPHLMPALKTAFDLTAGTFEQILEDHNPDLLIYDFIQPWAPLAAQRCNIPAVLFLSTGGAASSFFSYYVKKGRADFPFPSVSLGSEKLNMDLLRMLEGEANGVSDGERFRGCIELSSSFVMVKSFRDIEGRYIDYLSHLFSKEILPAGPLVSAMEKDQKQFCKIFSWLDNKQDSSVVYASFGSEYFMDEEETLEMACGLKLSGANFIWVIRSPRQETETETGGGFLQSLAGEDKGLIVKEWAPQRRVLAHRSIGCFLTHCGWSSVMEGLAVGVPLVGLPLHLDQPINAKLVVEIGAGVEVEKVKRGDSWMFRGEEVAKAIKAVMGDEDGAGKGIRKRAKDIAERISVEEEQGIDILVKKIARLCNKH